MRPPRSRTWGRRGTTPVIRVRGGGIGHVSIAGLACYRPGHQSRLIYRLHHYRGRKGETKAFTWIEYRDLAQAKQPGAESTRTVELSLTFSEELGDAPEP